MSLTNPSYRVPIAVSTLGNLAAASLQLPYPLLISTNSDIILCKLVALIEANLSVAFSLFIIFLYLGKFCNNTEA